jgi:hypothetical protein
MGAMQKRFGFSAFWVKLAMAGLMVLDHLHQYLWLGPVWWHLASRVVAPVFAFFVAVGMCRTRNRAAYTLRLAGFGVVTQLVNTWLSAALSVSIPNNIFLPLATGAGIILCVGSAMKKGHVPLYASATVLLLYAAQSFMEGGMLVPLMIALFYYLRDKRLLMYMCYFLAVSLLYLPQYFTAGIIVDQFYMIFAVLIIMLYNGERGPRNLAAKYFFYLFYPLHIWIIVLITALN